MLGKSKFQRNPLIQYSNMFTLEKVYTFKCRFQDQLEIFFARI